MKSIGENISSVRKSAGMTQEKLAEAMMVTPQAVSKWETDAACPDIDTVNRMAKLFGVTVDYLLNGNQEQPSAERGCPEEVGKRIIVINTNKGDSNIKVRVPVEAVRTLNGSQTIKNYAGKHIAEIGGILNLIDNGIVGSIVNVDSNGCNIQISVEEYEH